ncbi:MAG: methionyl-tRNA synthetase, methionyl-tRNA synthetase [Candidatus Adlerbacteria bacterium]|nr:methionyl-tRNA synthetase, methionyl-tRNA synthetase [Candidatus Adlerbacteria bacterium]
MADKKFYLTTPIFYPNAKLHLGHAYTTTVSDILVRYHRLMGEKTYFLTGSDENTQKMVDAARKDGKEPLEFLDGIVARFSSLFSELSISYDQFIRTTDQKAHWPGAQALWQKLVEAGDIYKKEYEGLYCVGHEAFITEKDLVDGKCPDHGTAPEFIKEENYFFRLSKYSDAIRQKIESDELLIVPATRKKEILSFIAQGLEDVSFSRPRKADWPQGLGIPVPGDDSQVMYVWCDALSNYITALGYGQGGELYEEFWPGMHVIGKDILRFHAAIWPGMLLSAGLPLPKTLLVHGFITSGGKKMSKTLGNVIDPEELLAEYGTDAVRCFLARHISPFEDGDITREAFKDAYNADLANGLGNLSARIMQLAATHLEQGTRPEAAEFPAEYIQAMEKFEINKAAEFIWSRIQALDQKITEQAPFKLVKTDLEAGKKIIFDLTQELYVIGCMLNPIMPETSKKIKDAVAANQKPENLFARHD